MVDIQNSLDELITKGLPVDATQKLKDGTALAFLSGVHLGIGAIGEILGKDAETQKKEMAILMFDITSNLDILTARYENEVTIIKKEFMQGAMQ